MTHQEKQTSYLQKIADAIAEQTGHNIRVTSSANERYPHYLYIDGGCRYYGTFDEVKTYLLGILLGLEIANDSKLFCFDTNGDIRMIQH